MSSGWGKGPRFIVLVGLAWCGAASSAFVGTAEAQTPHGWSWPTDSIDGIVAGSRGWYEARTDSGARGPAALADGSLVVHIDAEERTSDLIGPRAFPSDTALVVYRHRGHLYSMYRGPAEAWRQAGTTVAAGQAIAHEGPDLFQFAILDAQSRRLLRPQSVLPMRVQLGGDGLPVLAFFQDGVIVRSRNLMEGSYQLAVPAEWLERFRLPQELVVLEDGFVRAHHRMFDPESVDRMVSLSGHMILAEGTLEPGQTRFDVEAVLFDGTVEQRTIRARVAPAQPLDRP